MWFTLRPSPYTALYIGYATSSNGTTWNVWPDPVLSPGPGAWDSKYVLIPAVLRQGDVYKMWYAGSDATTDKGRAIGYATVAPIVVSATIDFDPNTLNLKSDGGWVTCFIELPEGYDVSDIDVSSVTLNGGVQAAPRPSEIGDYDMDGIADLMVKFDRPELGATLEPGTDVAVTVTGAVGTEQFSGTDHINVINPPGFPHAGGTDATQAEDISLELQPNPFNPSVRIQYEVPQPAGVLVQILTVNGRVVRTLEDTQRPAGTYAVEWDGKDGGGTSVSSGLYICRLVVGSRVVTQKLTLVK
jgi:hypothetical protein